MAKNERKTENIVREELRKCGFYNSAANIQVEEQKSHIEDVRFLLKTASKSGGGGGGAPEFIVSSSENPDFLLIIECKASTSDHASAKVKKIINRKDFDESNQEKVKRTQKYAADGVLHYAKFLSKKFNVICVAVSGETKESAIASSYLWPRNLLKPKGLVSKSGAELLNIIPWNDYIEHATFDPSIQKLRFDELMDFASDLHEFMRDHAKLTESEKPLLVSGTLIALRNKAFAAS